jgi:hypothetical protein
MMNTNGRVAVSSRFSLRQPHPVTNQPKAATCDQVEDRPPAPLRRTGDFFVFAGHKLGIIQPHLPIPPLIALDKPERRSEATPPLPDLRDSAWAAGAGLGVTPLDVSTDEQTAQLEGQV